MSDIECRGLIGLLYNYQKWSDRQTDRHETDKLHITEDSDTTLVQIPDTYWEIDWYNI